MLAVISVSKSYIHRGNHRHKQNTRKHWHLYYIDNDGKFKMRRINPVEAMYYKAQKKHRYRYVCMNCSLKFVAVVKARDDAVQCPYCS